MYRCLGGWPAMTLGAFSVLAIVTGCGGGGDGDGGGPTTATLDAEWATRAVRWVEEVVPGCETQVVTQSTLDVLQAGMAHMEELIELASIVPASAEQHRVTRTLSISGPCGGSVEVDSSHARGVTDFLMDFEQYCVNTVDGPTRIHGEIKAKEIGTPTDSGPRISELRASVSNLELTQGADRTVVSVDSARTVYGRPATWAPDVPQPDETDKFSVKNVTMDFKTRGTRDEIHNLSAERHGPRDQAMVQVKGGRYVRGETNERFDVVGVPGQPMVVNVDDAHWVQGPLDLKGANNSTVRVTPGATRGEFDVTVNGEPLGQQADCQGANPPLTHMADLFIDQLPLY